jgi:hypothetical protein
MDRAVSLEWRDTVCDFVPMRRSGSMDGIDSDSCLKVSLLPGDFATPRANDDA